MPMINKKRILKKMPNKEDRKYKRVSFSNEWMKVITICAVGFKIIIKYYNG